MEEMKKVRRVAGRALHGAPHAVWLVLDATTGQNAPGPGSGFQRSGRRDRRHSRQAGCLGAWRHGLRDPSELGLPIMFVGAGEGLEDLQVFDPDGFVAGVLA